MGRPKLAPEKRLRNHVGLGFDDATWAGIQHVSDLAEMAPQAWCRAAVLDALDHALAPDVMIDLDTD